MGLESAGEVGFGRVFKTKSTSLQFLVVAIVDKSREAAREVIDSGKLPAVESLCGKALHFRDGQFPDIVENETMTGIEKRRSVGGVEVKRIQDFLKAGGVVQRLAVSV